MTVRQARKELMKRGWCCLRQRGSHEQWVGPNRTKLTLVKHARESEELGRAARKEFRRKVLEQGPAPSEDA